MSPATRTVSAIEQQSYDILRSRADLSALPPLTRAVTERVIHASADLDYLTDLRCDEPALASGVAALRAGAPVVTDVAMVAAGITAYDGSTVVALELPGVRERAAMTGRTRSAAGVDTAVDAVGAGAVWVIGCAPTALFALLEAAQRVPPALVIGLPVGFVGAAESKAALRSAADRWGLPAVSNVSEKGGSAVAAAALNALLYDGGGRYDGGLSSHRPTSDPDLAEGTS